MSPDPIDLLERHRPVLKYDSQESYFADSAAEWTDNPGNRLQRADGTVIAEQGKGLSLAFLGEQYDRRTARKTDVISNPGKTYREEARRLHDDPRYGNRMYGHVAHDANGDIWLQYWFFYFYNDYNLIGHIIRAGLHEGDWEMVQLHVVDGGPDLAVYAQHRRAEARDWRQVDVAPGTERPVVYVARGSHASYFTPGPHWTGFWFDWADGARPRSPEVALEIVDETKPEWHWVRWPGLWGDTKPGNRPMDSPSPIGPGVHPQWDEPLALLPAGAAAPVQAPRQALPPRPGVAAAWDGERIVVRYDVSPSADGAWPVGIAVTLNSPDETAPPTTESFPITEGRSSGEVELATAVDPARTYDIHASVVTADGHASGSVRVDLPPRSVGRVDE
jgi:hypothetical protein